jgi:hypothetical protein
MFPVLAYTSNIVMLLLQTDEVSADILINHANFKWWWSFHNLKASENISACEGMDGPVAIIMSEETPPRKLALLIQVLFHNSCSIIDTENNMQRAFWVTPSASSVYGDSISHLY